MFKDLVELKRTGYYDSFNDWKTAIEASCKPLIDQNCIEHEYVDSIISCIEEYGPYIVLLPKIAVPHSSSKKDSVKQTCISFMKVEEPVVFDVNGDRKEANVFITIAAADNEIHMSLIAELADLLNDPERVEKLLSVKNDEDLLKI